MWILWKHSLRFYEAPMRQPTLFKTPSICSYLWSLDRSLRRHSWGWMLGVSLHIQNMEFVFSGHQTWNVATQEHNQTICAPIGCYRETSSQWIPPHFLLISPWNCWLWYISKNHGLKLSKRHQSRIPRLTPQSKNLHLPPWPHHSSQSE